MLNSIRRSATTRNTPTPQATARINVRFGTAGTCCASTCRSGSDIVIIKPSKKDSATTTHSFLDCVIAVPTRSPIGDIASSAPSVKNTIPAISNIPPIRKHSKILGEIGAIVKDSSSTSPMMGNTACSASFSFSFSFFRIPKQPPDLSFISGNGMFTERAFYFIHDNGMLLERAFYCFVLLISISLLRMVVSICVSSASASRRLFLPSS